MGRRPISADVAPTRYLLVALVFGLFGPVVAASQEFPGNAVTIEWDANDEIEGVIGYFVYVGTHPGRYQEIFDVANQTSFSYTNIVAGVRYYFSVAAYTEEAVVGPRSREVSTATSGIHRSAASTVDGARAAVPSGRDVLAEGLGAVTGLTAMDDGRLLVIENAQRIRVIDGALVREPALTIDQRGTRFTEIVMDPAFEQNHYVYVGVAEPAPRGTREFSIVRYRAVQDTLGDGSVIVSGLALYGPDDPRFTIDEDGRLYVAMPATGAGRDDPFAGHILRFNRDGSVVDGSRALSPVLARGVEVPAALEWDGAELWVIAGGATAQPFARLAIDARDEHAWPGSPRVLPISPAMTGEVRDFGSTPSSSPSAAGFAFLVDAAFQLFSVRSESNAAAHITSIDWPSDQRPVAVAIGPGGVLFVAAQRTDGTYMIVSCSLSGTVNAANR